MVAAVQIYATVELEAIEPRIDEALRRLEKSLNALPPAEVAEVAEAAARALDTTEVAVPEVIGLLIGKHHFSAEERVEAEVDVLMRSFARRRELLAGALSTSQVARLLGTTRQTPHDRVAAGSLLAVMDRGVLRFPPWQFDPGGPDGVVAGLPAVLRALEVSPMAKLSWLTRANLQLDGETPLTCLKAGQCERVVALARSVGIA